EKPPQIASTAMIRSHRPQPQSWPPKRPCERSFTLWLFAKYEIAVMTRRIPTDTNTTAANVSQPGRLRASNGSVDIVDIDRFLLPLSIRGLSAHSLSDAADGAITLRG